MLIALFLQGCGYFSPSEETENGDGQKPVARVYDNYLYPGEINDFLAENPAGIDSSGKAPQYLDGWIKRQLMLNKAKEQVDPDALEIDKMVEKYREDLLIAALKRTIAAEAGKKEVKEEEIEAYYKNNKESFRLNQVILKCRFVKLPVGTPKQEEVKKWIQSDDSTQLKALQLHCVSFSPVYHLNDDEWRDFDEIISESPFEDVTDKVRFLLETKFTQRSDSNYVYYLKVLDRKITDEVPPLPFIRDRIKNIIIGKRKAEAIQRFEEEIYNEASNKNAVEIYR